MERKGSVLLIEDRINDFRLGDGYNLKQSCAESACRPADKIRERYGKKAIGLGGGIRRASDTDENARKEEKA